MKQCLIVVDYQNDFVCGSLGFPKAAALEEGICAKIAQYREQGGDIIFTLDTHQENYLATQEGKKLPVSHCIEGTQGWQLYGKAARLCRPEDIQIKKPTFPSLELANLLKDKAYDKVELVGVVTDICVIANAVMVKAALPEAEIVVDAACTSTMDEGSKEKALDVMQCLQITVMNR